MIRENLVKEYCCEDISLIENYQKAIEDNTQTWHCHHRLEICDENGKERPLQKSRDELIAENRYYNRPASELIFLTKSEHRCLHMKHMSIYGYNHKNTTGSGSMKGKFLSENQKEKISESKIGRHYWNNGIKNVMVFECPGEGWKRGKLITVEDQDRLQRLGKSNKGRKLSEETKKKISEAHKGLIKSNSISFEDIEFAKSHTNKECFEQKGWSAEKCWRLRRNNR